MSLLSKDKTVIVPPEAVAVIGDAPNDAGEPVTADDDVVMMTMMMP